MKVACSPLSIPLNTPVDFQYVLFCRPAAPTLGTAGPTLFENVSRFGISPHARAWDLLSIALAVTAADEACRRNISSDGWTRNIQLQVAVQDVTFWRSQQSLLHQILRFLTNDIWEIEFQKGGAAPPRVKKNQRDSQEDCVCLLSGGADSLTGAIDIVTEGKHPLLVSQVSDGDKESQRTFANAAAGPNHHLQLNHNIRTPGVAERSQRSRSFLFITYGVLGASCLRDYNAGKKVELFIPENGFISLNIPLTPLRVGSLSTRTTHPYYLGLFQQLLNAAGLSVTLENPCMDKTKGELFERCRNQDLLKRLVCESTSCGRYARTGFMHCGRCVPCLIRRAAFNRWGVMDTTRYRYENLSLNDDQHRNYDDVRSACFAVQKVKSDGLDKWIGGALSTTQLGETTDYRALLGRGMEELSNFLSHAGAL